VESGGTSQRAHEATRTSHAEEVTEHGEVWPGRPDWKSRDCSGGTRSLRRQHGERQPRERRDVVAGPRGRAHVACRGGHRTRRGVARRARLEEQGRLRGHPEPEMSAWRAPSWRVAGRSSGPIRLRRPRARRMLRRSQCTARRGPAGQTGRKGPAPGRGTRSPRRQLGKRQRGERRDVAAGPRGSVHFACLGGHRTWRGVARRARPDWKSRAGSGASRARDASLENASLERDGTS
jgi:hypothetical protein